MPYTPAPSSGDLKQGMSGDRVRDLQNRLKAAGFDPGPIDGLYGAKTAAAVKAFQSSKNINQSGTSDWSTWKALTGGKATSSKDGQASSGGGLADQVRKEFPGLAPFLDVPELKSLLEKASKERWTSDRFIAEVRGTSWWKQHSLTQQEWQTLPDAEKKQRIDTTVAQMVDYFHQLYGADYLNEKLPWKIDPNSAELKRNAEAVASGQESFEHWQYRQMTLALGNPDSLASVNSKEAENTARRIQQKPEEIAEDFYKRARLNYWVPLTKANALSWAKKVNEGTNSEADFDDYLRKQAKTLYPEFQKQIDNGTEPGTLFAPYANAASDLLEISPDAVVMDDRVFGSFFQDTATDGKFPSMQAFKDRIRQMNEWQYTDNANQTAADGALSIARTFGKIV